MSNVRARLGSEHPQCDSIQLVMLTLFFVVLIVDSLGFFIFGISTILIEFSSAFLLLFPALFSWSFGIYLAMRSHKAVFGSTSDQPKLNNSGVYSWVRHPMYLGTLLFCLGFLFIIPSLFSFGIWIAFFIFYDRMATYEERDLKQIIGEEYINYQRQVPKWFPFWRRRKSE